MSDDGATLLRTAWQVRAPLRAALPATDTGRLLDGRHEGLPGWTVDRYGPAALIRSFDREGADEEVVSQLVRGLRELLGPDVIVHLKERCRRDDDGRLVAGTWPAAEEDDPLAGRPGRLVVREEGLRFGVDLARGWNTGLFGDARPMRRWLRAQSGERRILNLFSFAGALGVAAASGGARSVTNVDLVDSALERGRASFTLNGLPWDSRSHLRAEVFDFCKRASKRDERWGGIVLDAPPLRVRKGRGRSRGWDPIADTPRLVERCMELLTPDGWLLLLGAMRGRERFEELLPGPLPEPMLRGTDFPGPIDDGLRAYVLRA